MKWAQIVLALMLLSLLAAAEAASALKVDLNLVFQLVHKNSGYVMTFAVESAAARERWAATLAKAMLQDAHSRQPEKV